MKGMMGASRMPLNLDLISTSEISKFAGKNPTSKNEAVDIYESIKPENFKSFIEKLEKSVQISHNPLEDNSPNKILKDL
jgi:hypothetical protein